MKETARKSSLGNRYLSFSLDKEEYCIDIGQVREIKALPEITVVPQTPEYIQGVINLRGKIIPIIDLRMRFGFEKVEYNARTSVIIVEYEYEGDIILIGIIVDVTNEVLHLDQEQIERVGYLNEKIREDFIDGMAHVKDKVVIKLNIENILGSTDMTLLNRAGVEKEEA